MAREHHCPNCGPQACNASTSKIHTCGVCAAIWEEDLSVPAPAPVKPSTPTPTAAAPAAPPRPAVPAPAAPKPATPSATPPAPVAKPVVPAEATPAPKPAPPAAPTPPPTPTPAAPSPPAPPRPSAAKTLSDVVQAAKVKRCPRCTSDGVAEPLDFLEVQGRIVLQDSQTYRAHQWYADTGELYTPPSTPPAALPPSQPVPATQPSA